MPLLRSNGNLSSGVADFLQANEEVFLFSAYIKTDKLKAINEKGKIKSIVVRWTIEDLCVGASDLDLYDYCHENGIALYRNTRLHMKAFWNKSSQILFGSANVTNRGLSLDGENSGNLELNGLINQLHFQDYRYLNDVLEQSEYITEDLYQEIKDLVESVSMPSLEFPDLPTKKTMQDFFLISQLPISSSPDDLYKYYSGEIDGDLAEQCAAHDLSIYKIGEGLSKAEFMSALSDVFNSHEFIVAFKNAVKNSVNSRNPERNGSMSFGMVRVWFKENTTTVPTPIAWELTENVQILYRWICFFDDDFEVVQPGRRSEVIRYIGR